MKAGGYLESAAQEAGMVWGEVTNYVANAEAEAKTVTSEALLTTTSVTKWLADTLKKFSKHLNCSYNWHQETHTLGMGFLLFC